MIFFYWMLCIKFRINLPSFLFSHLPILLSSCFKFMLRNMAGNIKKVQVKNR